LQNACSPLVYAVRVTTFYMIISFTKIYGFIDCAY